MPGSPILKNEPPARAKKERLDIFLDLFMVSLPSLPIITDGNDLFQVMRWLMQGRLWMIGVVLFGSERAVAGAGTTAYGDGFLLLLHLVLTAQSVFG